MVAKSYQSLNVITEPYLKNKRMYILVETKSGKEKEIRWYTNQEYAKMYPEEKKDKTKDPYYKSQKYVLGFDEGYIWILKNPTEENEESQEEAAAEETAPVEETAAEEESKEE